MQDGFLAHLRCNPCVYDLYEDRLADYEELLEALQPPRRGEPWHVALTVAGVTRDYTPLPGAERDRLELVVKTVEGGALTPRLAALPAGSEVIDRF